MLDKNETLLQAMRSCTTTLVRIEQAIARTERLLWPDEVLILRICEKSLELAEVAFEDCRLILHPENLAEAQDHIEALRRRFDAAKATYLDRLSSEES